MEAQQIIDRIDHELHKYYKEVVPSLNKYSNEKRLKYKIILDGLFQFYIFCGYLFDKNKFPNDSSIDILRSIFAKTALSVYGMYSCLANGLLSEACILSRTIFEAYINVRIILESDTNERLKLYDNYRHVQKWLNLKENKKLVEADLLSIADFENSFPAHLRDTVTNKFEEIKDDYHPKIPYHWAWKIFKDRNKGKNPSVKFLAGEYGLHGDYIRIYTSLSISVHPTPLIDNLISKDGIKTLAPIYSKSFVHVSMIGINYCGEIALEILKAYSPSNVYSEMSLFVHAFFLGLSEKCKNV